MPQAKERPIATVPIIPATLRGSARKPSAITIEPSSGNSRTSQHQAVAVMNNSASQAPRSSAAQLPQIVDVERQTAAENGDDQAKADDDLTGGDHHHDHREDLTLLVADHAAEGDEGEVAGVQHQLEAEQDHHRRSPDQDPQDAGGEEQGRQDDVPGDVHGWGARRRAARTIAPTAASKRRIELASKGRRNFSRRSLPIAAGSPKPALT